MHFISRDSAALAGDTETSLHPTCVQTVHTMHAMYTLDTWYEYVASTMQKFQAPGCPGDYTF